MACTEEAKAALTEGYRLGYQAGYVAGLQEAMTLAQAVVAALPRDRERGAVLRRLREVKTEAMRARLIEPVLHVGERIMRRSG